MVKRVMIIAGEASGDLHGSGVVRELKRIDETMDIYGVGGDKMKREGMTLVYHIRELGFMGFVEVLKHLPLIRTMERTLEQIVKFKKPDVLVLIDYPGFNLRFAAIAKRYGVKIVYYISPQVWAWNKSRVKKMRGLVDKMLVIFPFEVPFYEHEGIDAEFVGHPLMEVLTAQLDRTNFCKRFGIDGGKNIIALFPGSRLQEIENIFPVMVRAAKGVAAELNMEIAVGVAPTLEEKYFKTFFKVEGAHLVKGGTYELMQHAHFAFVTSGTATLETACFSTPMFVVYRTSWLTYLVGRMMVRVKNIGLVNIVAEKEIVPEFIQHRATANNLLREALKLLKDPDRLAQMKVELSKIRGMLGAHGASRMVAQRIVEMA
ncbi:MAG TPA: lipid-A-disaccharide synthase [Bacteroidota bacterium]